MSDRIDLLAVLPKATDLETHVRLLTFGEREILELVDFVPSLDQYWRGYWLPMADRGAWGALGRALTGLSTA